MIIICISYSERSPGKILLNNIKQYLSLLLTSDNHFPSFFRFFLDTTKKIKGPIQSHYLLNQYKNLIDSCYICIKEYYMAKKRQSNTRGRKGKTATGKYAVGLIIFAAVIWIGAQYMLSKDKEMRNPEEYNPTAEYVLNVRSNPNQPEKIIEYTGFTVSYNPELHIPNWVCWELTADEAAGSEPRGNFAPDPDVPDCPVPSDYTHTGYDRGHIAPAGDMKWSEEAMNQCFYMTNMVPQEPTLNRGPWNKLEQKCRQRAMTDSAIIIISGPVLGKGKSDIREYLSRRRIAVPQKLFKVIFSPYAERPRMMGFIFPNDEIKGGMQPYAVCVDSVEAVTGMDFFYWLPDSLETALEKECDFNKWSNMK